MTEITIPKNREELLQECAPIAYKEIENFFARGMLILISEDTDIIDVAMIIQTDNTNLLEKLIKQGQVVRAHDDHAIKWSHENTQLMAITAVPWLLVKELK